MPASPVRAGPPKKLARSGHIRFNRDKVRDASRLVRAGDVLTLNLRRGIRVIRVLGIAERRGGFPEARLLYEDAVGSPSTPAEAGHWSIADPEDG